MAKTSDGQPVSLEEALAIIKQLQAAQSQAEKKLEEKEVELKEAKKQEEGWLIYTTNPSYDGNVYGVNFVNGAAFVPANKVFPDYEFPKNVKKGKLEKMDAEERKVWEQRSKLSSAYRVVELIVNDFGYSSTYINSDNADKLNEFNAQRAKERADADREMSKLESTNTLIRPGVVQTTLR